MLLVCLKELCITGNQNIENQIKVSIHSLHKNESQKEEEARKKGEEVTEPVVERIIDERRARRDELLDLLSDVDQLIEDENE